MADEDQQLVKKKAITGVLWMLGERFGAQLISLIVQILLARLLFPEEYGVVAIASVLVALSNVLATSGLSMALVQKKKADELDFSTAFFMNLGFSLLLYLIVFLIAPLLGDMYEKPELVNVLRVLGIIIPIYSVNSVQRSFVSRNMLFKRFFYSTLIANITAGALGVAAAAAGWSVWALVVQSCSAAILDFLVLWVTVKWRPHLMFSFGRFCGLFSFGWKVLASNMLYEGFRQLRALIIGKVYSSADLAFYNRGEHLPSLLSVNLDSALQSVLLPVMSREQDDRARILALLRKTVSVGCFVVFPVMAGLAAVAEPLIELLLTEKWLPCVPFVWIFCLAYAFQSIQAGCLQAIRAVGKSDVTLGQDCVKRAVDLILLLVAVPHGVYAIALAGLVGAFVSLVVNYAPCVRMFSYRVRDLMRDIIPSFAVALVMGLLVRLLSLVGLPLLPQLVLQIAVGIASYSILSAVFHLDGFTFIRSFIVENFGLKGKE